MEYGVSNQGLQVLGEMIGCIMGGASTEGYDGSEWNIRLVILGLSEEIVGTRRGQSHSVYFRQKLFVTIAFFQPGVNKLKESAVFD